MQRKNTLNNMRMKNIRKDAVYQAVITDLALSGSIDIKVAEGLLGYKIPDYIKLPDYFEQFCSDGNEDEDSEDEDDEKDGGEDEDNEKDGDEDEDEDEDEDDEKDGGEDEDEDDSEDD